MKIKLDVKGIENEKEKLIANYIKIMIDETMFLLKAIDKLEYMEEEEE